MPAYAATVRPITRPRTNGRFASPADPTAITMVYLPGSSIVGYQVGPNGRIYAKREDAERWAAVRREASAIRAAETEAKLNGTFGEF